MSCILNKGISLPCRTGKGGVFELYLGTYSGTTSFTADSTGVLTGATGFNTFYQFEFPSETASAVETGTFSKENQTVLFEQVITANVYELDATSRDTISLLTQARLFALVRDNRSKYYLYGYQDGMWVTGAEINLGTTYEDMNGAILTLTGREGASAKECSAALLATLIA